jgi:hypothetical protein
VSAVLVVEVGGDTAGVRTTVLQELELDESAA